MRELSSESTQRSISVRSLMGTAVSWKCQPSTLAYMVRNEYIWNSLTKKERLMS